MPYSVIAVPNSRPRSPKGGLRNTDPPFELGGAIISAKRPVALDDEAEELSDADILVDHDEHPPTTTDPSPPQIFEPALRGPKPESLTVLVVEDDDSIRAMTIRALATQYTVFEAVDGIHALAILEAIPPPACIVSDVMMPRLDGFGLAKRIKASPTLKATPIIFLTAKNSALDVVQGINAGARHYLNKPFKMKELLEKVGSVVTGPRKGG